MRLGCWRFMEHFTVFHISIPHMWERYVFGICFLMAASYSLPPSHCYFWFLRFLSQMELPPSPFFPLSDSSLLKVSSSFFSQWKKTTLRGLPPASCCVNWVIRLGFLRCCLWFFVKPLPLSVSWFCRCFSFFNIRSSNFAGRQWVCICESHCVV